MTIESRPILSPEQKTFLTGLLVTGGKGCIGSVSRPTRTAQALATAGLIEITPHPSKACKFRIATLTAKGRDRAEGLARRGEG